MDNARPSLDLDHFDKVCPDKNGTSNSSFMHEGGRTRILLVPVIAVFTKYDQFRREINFKLEDQGLGTSTEPGLLNAEVERIFEKQYLANLRGAAPFVRLESEKFVN
jgi:hypothetical protein